MTPNPTVKDIQEQLNLSLLQSHDLHQAMRAHGGLAHYAKLVNGTLRTKTWNVNQYVDYVESSDRPKPLLMFTGGVYVIGEIREVVRSWNE